MAASIRLILCATLVAAIARGGPSLAQDALIPAPNPALPPRRSIT